MKFQITSFDPSTDHEFFQEALIMHCMLEADHEVGIEIALEEMGLERVMWELFGAYSVEDLFFIDAQAEVVAEAMRVMANANRHQVPVVGTTFTVRERVTA